MPPVIIRLFNAGLADLAEPDGVIILSGILKEQVNGVIEAGQSKGLRLSESRESGDWVALAMRR